MPRLVPCPQCKRHVRASETSCPHCGKSSGAFTFAVFTMTAGLAIAGCADPGPVAVYGPPPVDPGARTATTTDTTPAPTQATVYGPPAVSPDDRQPQPDPSDTAPVVPTASGAPSAGPSALPTGPKAVAPPSSPDRNPPATVYGPPAPKPTVRVPPKGNP